MKSTIILFASLFSLSMATLSHAQEFVTQNFGPSSTPGNYTSTVTLAKAGPLIFILGTEFNYGADQSNQPPSSADITVAIDNGTPFTIPGKNLVVTQHPTDPNNGQVYATSISSLTYTTATLQPGNHTITVTFNSKWDTQGSTTQGGYTIIAPNELPSGITDAINTVTTEIQSNTNAISAFQDQLSGIETTLQNEIDSANANISSLTSQIQTLQASQSDSQTTEASQADQISTLQGQVTQLQQQISQLQAALAAIPPPVTTPNYTSQFDSLQNQISSLKRTNKDQWIALGGVGLLGAVGTTISVYELSHGGNSTSSSTAISHTSTSSYNPYSKNN